VRILLIGGTGFVGTNVTLHALSSGHEVWIAVRSRNPYAERLERSGALILSSHREKIREADCLVYLVGALGRRREADYLELQVRAPERIGKEFAAVNSGKFVYVSSVGVLGFPGGSERPIREEKEICEGLQPGTLHGRTKCMGEKAISSLPNHAILRFPIVYGPYSRTPLWRGIMRAARMGLGIRNSNPFSVISTANASRAVESACASKASGFYYASDPSPATLTEVFSLAAEVQGRDVELWLPMGSGILNLLSHFGELFRLARDIISGSLVVSSEKAQREIGYQPLDVRRETFKVMAQYYGKSGFR